LMEPNSIRLGVGGAGVFLNEVKNRINLFFRVVRHFGRKVAKTAQMARNPLKQLRTITPVTR